MSALIKQTCQHFGPCAGCSENLSFNSPPIWDEIVSSYDLENRPFLHRGSPFHWRHRAKVAVRGVADNPLIGLFKKNSHEVFPIPHCLVHHPYLNTAFESVRQWMLENHILPYQEKTGLGDLRYLQGIVQREGGKVQLTFVINLKPGNGYEINNWVKKLTFFAEKNQHICNSVWINFNPHQTNTIFCSTWLHVWGEKEIWENLGNIHVCYGPASFGQANLPLFEKMLNQIVEFLPANAKVAEFYAGVGAIGLFILPHCQWVRCSEINPFSQKYFDCSCTKMEINDRSKITFATAPVHKSLSLLNEATTAIVDPPRKGLDRSLFPAFRNYSSLRQIVYISCGWESFKKDSQQLLTEGWKLNSLDGYLFFPGSSHVELLGNFVKI